MQKLIIFHSSCTLHNFSKSLPHYLYSMISDATTDPPNFGQHYAILNLDWMSILIGAVENTPEGQALIANYIRWDEAVHQKTPRPLTIFTSLSFSHGQPEIERNKPFANLIAPFGTFEAGSPEAQIDSRFKVDEKDVVLPKTRGAATTGNALEQILKAQGIETVIIVSDEHVITFIGLMLMVC